MQPNIHPVIMRNIYFVTSNILPHRLSIYFFLCMCSQFYAVYAFAARCEQELSLQEYQHVRILQFSDLGGNKDWWLAESNGQKGYVPANYLGKMSYA